MSVMDLLITLAAQCASSQFRCDNGQCISSSVHGQCDGRTGGCTDGSDERGCRKLYSSPFDLGS